MQSMSIGDAEIEMLAAAIRGRVDISAPYAVLLLLPKHVSPGCSCEVVEVGYSCVAHADRPGSGWLVPQLLAGAAISPATNDASAQMHRCRSWRQLLLQSTSKRPHRCQLAIDHTSEEGR